MWGRGREAGCEGNTMVRVGGVPEEASQSQTLKVRTTEGSGGSSPLAKAEHGGFQSWFSRDSRGARAAGPVSKEQRA